jgi:RNA polymerase sigma-70 factor (ECF subfamily)
VEQQVIARRALSRLHQALADLSDRRRSVFVLCAVEGLDPSEAAEILGISANATRSLLCRARQDVEEALARREGEGGER